LLAPPRPPPFPYTTLFRSPSFGPLEALERVFVDAFPIEQGERAVPVALERFLDDAVSLATIPHLDESARRGGRDLGMQALGARRVFPVPSEAFTIYGLARQYRDAGVDSHAIARFRRPRILFL